MREPHTSAVHGCVNVAFRTSLEERVNTGRTHASALPVTKKATAVYVLAVASTRLRVLTR